MLKRKIPMRKCIGCNETKPKKELIRIVRNPEGNILLDPTGKAAGRGAYICCDTACLDLAIKNKRLQKSFEANVPDDLYEKLSQELKRKNG